jgi:hypothetical protein
MITDLSEFTPNQLRRAGEILIAYSNGDYDFYTDDVKLVVNNMHDNVFLTNVDSQVLMMNDSNLERFYSCPYTGQEGFRDEFLDDFWNYNTTLDRIEWLYYEMFNAMEEFVKFLFGSREEITIDWIMESVTEYSYGIMSLFIKLYSDQDLDFLSEDEKENLIKLVIAKEFDLAAVLLGFEDLKDLFVNGKRNTRESSSND